MQARWPDEPASRNKVHRVEDVLAGCFLAALIAVALLFTFWHASRVDDGLDRVPTTYPEERYESDAPGT